MNRNKKLKKFDCSGYATKNDLVCADGVTIKHGAFAEQDGAIVPVVYAHQHKEPAAVLGHALLENRDDGVYCHVSFNNTQQGQDAKEYVEHGDINHFSIFANELVKRGQDVVHGMIREVSLVLAGANPGAIIDHPTLAHGAGFDDTEGTIFGGSDVVYIDKLEHSMEEKEDMIVIENEDLEVLIHAAMDGEVDDETATEATEIINEVYDSLNPAQKELVDGLIAQLESEEEDEETEEDEEEDDDEGVEHSLLGGKTVRRNVFEKGGKGGTLKHDAVDTTAIFHDAAECGSLQKACIAHGITGIEKMFPDAQFVDNQPAILYDGWIGHILNSCKKLPFTRVKTLIADLTEDTARAKGYIKGNQKIEEVFSLLTRSTDPQTIYKKQSLERDDILDIKDFNVVQWLDQEMDMMIKEELARCILIPDGRQVTDKDKVKEDKIRPISTDTTNDLYAISVVVDIKTGAANDEICQAILDGYLAKRWHYQGLGQPEAYMHPELLQMFLSMKDKMGRDLYPTVDSLKVKMRVSDIVEIPVMDHATDKTAIIIVNLADYAIGTDKGGQITSFDDFDLDYNKYKYLKETRVSGALYKPKSAMVISYHLSAAAGA